MSGKERWATPSIHRIHAAPERDGLLPLEPGLRHERKAAPIACWLAARAGVEPEQAIRLAKELTDG